MTAEDVAPAPSAMVGLAGADARRRVLLLRVLGCSIGVVLHGTTDVEAHTLVALWQRCGGELVGGRVPKGSVVIRGLLAHDNRIPEDVRIGPGDVVENEFRAFSERLSVVVTHIGLSHRMHDHVLFHAGGVVEARTGTAIALIGPSGRGKTTAISVLGTRFGYLSDETVAVADDGAVLPFPKPLSIREAPAGVPKTQRAPGDLGLLESGVQRSVLRRLLVLDRRPGTSTPVLERVSLAAVVADMLGQLSYIEARDAPLQRLQRLIDACGGIFRVQYSEAESIVPVVAHLLESAGTEAIARPRALQRDHRLQHAAAQDAPGAHWRHSDAVLDWVDDEDAVLVLANGSVTVLEGVGAAVWRALASPAPASVVTASVVAELGEAPDGGSDGLVEAALRHLREEGLLNREE